MRTHVGNINYNEKKSFAWEYCTRTTSHPNANKNYILYTQSKLSAKHAQYRFFSSSRVHCFYYVFVTLYYVLHTIGIW